MIEVRLVQFPAVAMLGPCRVGKTTLAKAIAASRGGGGTTSLDLELPSDQEKLADPVLHPAGLAYGCGVIAMIVISPFSGP
ncbi:MAG: hypothetical protein WCK33_06710 [Phycisphaerae bacterium]|jgi:predicted AAA+ superfamily ATPase